MNLRTRTFYHPTRHRRRRRSHELLRRGGAPDRASACRRGCSRLDALISAQARGGAQARARRRRRVVALRARRHGPRARRRTGRVPRPFCFCVSSWASRRNEDLGQLRGSRRGRSTTLYQMKYFTPGWALVVGHRPGGRGKNAAHHERRPSPTRRGGRAQHAIAQARDELGIEPGPLPNAPPAADRWVHRARYEVRFSASFAVARAAVVRQAPTRRLDPAARWPGARGRAYFGSSTRETPPRDAIDATRYEKRRRNAATRRSRPSRPR